MAQKKDVKTGKWFYYGSYKDGSGKPHQYKKRGFETRREARMAEDDFRDKLFNPEETLSLRELTARYEARSKTRVKESTRRKHAYLIDKINGKFGDVLLKDLNKRDLQEWIDELDSKYSKRYVEKIYFTFSSILNHGVNEGLMEKNPMKTVTRDTRLNEKPKEMLFWEQDEFEKFIDVVDEEMYKVLFMTLYYMGLRKGEALALQWRDIDMNRRTINIEKTTGAFDRNKEDATTTPKTKNSYRRITMPRVLYDEMKKWKTKCEGFVGYSERLFVFGIDKPIPPENLRRNFLKWTQKANVKQIRIHDLRHSHASYLINNMSEGFTDFDIAQRLGDTVDTLHKTYAHWFQKADKGIIDFMDRKRG